MATTTPKRPCTYVSGWTTRTVTPDALEQWEREWRANRPPLPADLAGIADDDLVTAIRIYAPDNGEVIRAYGELERRERDAAERAAERAARIDALVAEGWDVLTAVAEVDGIDPQILRVREAAAAAGRRPGESPRQALRRQYDEWAETRYLQAETDCRGHLLNAAGRDAGVDPRRLFTGPLWLVARWATGDLLDWWDRNGRITFTQFHTMATGRPS